LDRRADECEVEGEHFDDLAERAAQVIKHREAQAGEGGETPIP
jgi:hypothetical protein